MNSIGNDVIDLARIQPERTAQYRFYSKILSPLEQAYYNSLPAGQLPFAHYVWLLWSVKESAYKFLKRLQPQLVFSPTKTEIQELLLPAQLPGTYTGIVAWQGISLNFQSEITARYIHTIVYAPAVLSQCIYGVHTILNSAYAAQSAAVRTEVLSELNRRIPDTSFNIIKDKAGCPEIISNMLAAAVPVSLSHDGNFVAYAFDQNQITPV